MILIVDNDRNLGTSLVRLLQLEGYETLWLPNGPEALELLRTRTPALIILDVNMSPMSGLVLLDLIQKDARLNPVPILMFTADTSDKTARKAKRLSATDVIHKSPSACEILLKRIAELIGKP